MYSIKNFVICCIFSLLPNLNFAIRHSKPEVQRLDTTLFCYSDHNEVRSAKIFFTWLKHEDWSITKVVFAFGWLSIWSHRSLKSWNWKIELPTSKNKTKIWCTLFITSVTKISRKLWYILRENVANQFCEILSQLRNVESSSFICRLPFPTVPNWHY